MKKLSLLSFLFLLSCSSLPITNTIYRPKYSKNSTSTVNEKREFADLIAKDKINKGREDAQVLTYLLNEPDPGDKFTAAVIENTSRCDIILRLVGTSNHRIYNLPISKNSKNQFVIEKGNYTLKSNVCDASYYSQKNITKPLSLKLSIN